MLNCDSILRTKFFNTMEMTVKDFYFYFLNFEIGKLLINSCFTLCLILFFLGRKTVYERLKECWDRVGEILWRFAELHFSKLVLLILTIIAVNDVSYFCQSARIFYG